MAGSKTFSPLRTPVDLLDKFRVDFRRMEEAPGDPYVAFDFFVTAEHLLDWVLPGDANHARQTGERTTVAHVLLQIVSHIANGFEHFTVERQHNQSVSQVDAPPASYSVTILMVTLEGSTATALGQRVAAIALAYKDTGLLGAQN